MRKQKLERAVLIMPVQTTQKYFMQKLFKNRFQAGNMLARRLADYVRHPDVIVLALPRGGVPLGYMVARALAAPLDVILVRKLGLPGQPEYAIGAVAGKGSYLLQTEELKLIGIPMGVVLAMVDREREEIARRETRYRTGKPALLLQGKNVILIDDGIATGSTMHMAIRVVRRAKPAKIIVAVPVAPSESCTALLPAVDALICLHTPTPFFSVGQWYEDFEQVSDEEVIRLLERAARRNTPSKGDGRTT
ncbi:phosphoribosyltransferase [Janthinobacterium sp. HLX7-2]|uniref:phosphoribosyltransferase n=1 Tax=Janthinobacterium sp. HLX7-2 TaxID=1259331 RepID=UPI003F29E9F2